MKPNEQTTIWRYSDSPHAATLIPLFLFGVIPLIVVVYLAILLVFSFATATSSFRETPYFNWACLVIMVGGTVAMGLAIVAVSMAVNSMKLAFVRLRDGSMYLIDYDLLTLEKNGAKQEIVKGSRRRGASASNPAMAAFDVTHDERALIAGATMGTAFAIADVMRTYRAERTMDEHRTLETCVANGRVGMLGNRIESVQRVERKLSFYRISCVVTTRQGKSYARKFAIARSFKDAHQLTEIFSAMVHPKAFYR